MDFLRSDLKNSYQKKKKDLLPFSIPYNQHNLLYSTSYQSQGEHMQGYLI